MNERNMDPREYVEALAEITLLMSARGLSIEACTVSEAAECLEVLIDENMWLRSNYHVKTERDFL